MKTYAQFVAEATEFRNTTGVPNKPAYVYIPGSSKIPGIGTTSNQKDAIAHIKLFDPTGSWTWYLTEADRTTGEAFGLVDGHEEELGYIDLNELAQFRGRMKLPIERDIHWTPRPLSQCRKSQVSPLDESYLTTIELRSAPELKRIVKAAFPGYAKKNVFLSKFSPTRINSFWDGGSRDIYVLIDLATMKDQPLPTSTHPYFDVAAKGMAGGSSDAVEVDPRGNITLKVLPDNFALVQAGTFQGKPSTAHIFLPDANMTKFLPAASSTTEPVI